MSVSPSWRCSLYAALALGALLPAPAAWAQVTATAAAAAPAAQAGPHNSALDAPLLYQLLIGEMELRSGQPGNAFQIIIDAARRTHDEALFRRAVDIALQARAGEQALQAARAWRQSRPESLDAVRTQLQILLAINRLEDMGEPLRALLAQTPVLQRPALIHSLPQFLQRSSDKQRVAQLLEDSLQAHASDPGLRLAVLVAQARSWLLAGDADRSLQLTRQAQALNPGSVDPVLLALALMDKKPQAEALVSAHLARADVPVGLRLAYARILTAAQRYTDAVAQLVIVTVQQPNEAGPFLTLGALHLELKHPKEAESALRRHVELAQAQSAANLASTGQAVESDEGQDAAPAERSPVTAWLMLAQVAEQQGDMLAAEKWLALIDDTKHALQVQSRRASMLARQGKMTQARELIRQAPELGPDDKREKLVAEAALLRDHSSWLEAFDLLGLANQQFVDDGDLLYTQAMMAEKLARLEVMERLLRRVIALKPDNAHAHNALGYALADRGQRLAEARALIQRALELAPGDPFITDSLGWLEFRTGNRDEALRLLRQAYAARPDTEIGAHLGEVLWSLGQQDEARRIWREVSRRESGNEVLRETLARLRIKL